MTALCQVYDEAQRMGIEDWEIWHNTGLCYMYLKQYTKVGAPPSLSTASGPRSRQPLTLAQPKLSERTPTINMTPSAPIE